MADHRVAGTKVTAYATGITPTDVQLVQPGTLGRVRQNGYREVCADAKGRVEAVDSSPDLTGLRRATFRPHQTDTFTTCNDGEPVHSAPLVVFAQAAA